jgi:hypothetical protein
MNAETLTLITGAATALTNAAISLLTLAWPQRPRYTAAVLALLVAVTACYLAALVYLPADYAFTRQTHASLILSGLLAGFAAGGLSYTQQSSETARAEQQVAERIGSRIYNSGGKA